MAIGKDDFIKKYPDFQGAPAALVDARLDYAKARVSQEAFGDYYEYALYTYTAHLISTSPNGVNARLKDGTNIYTQEWDRIKLLHFKRGLEY